jgi:DNA anti-recombination protein RmuC
MYVYIHTLRKYKKLKVNSKNIISKLKKLYTELFNKKFPENFDGLDMIKTLEHAANKYNIKFIMYNNDRNKRLRHLNTIGEGENKHNLLMITGLDEEKIKLFM